MSTTAHYEPPVAQPRQPSGLRRQATIWLVVLLSVALLLGLVWLLGGFDRRATPYMGTRLALGETAETRFWDYAVHSAQVDEYGAAIDLAITVTNKQDTSEMQLTYSSVMIRLPDAEVMTTHFCATGDRSQFGPDIPTEALCEFSYESNEISQPPEAPFRVEVIVLDQVIHEELLTEPRPRANNAVAHFELEVMPYVEEES